MDFSGTLRDDNTSLGTVKEVIKKWHGGRISSLTVCKHSFQQMNELHEDNLSLKECGIDGSIDKNQAPVVTLYYDFKPECTDADPILMCWHKVEIEVVRNDHLTTSAEEPSNRNS